MLLLGSIIKSMFHGIISLISIQILCNTIQAKPNLCKISRLISHFLLSTLQRRLSFLKAHSVTIFVILLTCSLNETKYSRMDKVKADHSLKRPYTFKVFKGCLPQILLGPFLNTLSQITFYSLSKLSSGRLHPKNQ